MAKMKISPEARATLVEVRRELRTLIARLQRKLDSMEPRQT